MSINQSEWLEEDNSATVNAPSPREIISKYLSYYPLFIISLLVFVGAAYLYLYTATPKYEITESILIKNRLTSPSTNGNNASGDLLSMALDGGSVMNIDNETQLIHSISLMERIVAKNHLNISYYEKRSLKKIDLYPETPFLFVKKDSNVGLQTINIDIDEISKDNIKIAAYTQDSGKMSLTVKWNQSFNLYGNQFTLLPVSNTNFENKKYSITWKPIKNTASDIADDLSVNIPDKKTTIIKLSLLAENTIKGQDILRWTIKEYNESNIEEKNIIAQNTLKFIDDRLNIATNELNGVEGHLEGFQGSSRLVDIQAQASQQLENTNDISKNINDIRIQQSVVSNLQDYFTNPASNNKLVPSSLGINDATLIALISKYNELQSKRTREAPQLAANSIVLQDLDSQINDVKTSINENLQNIKKNLQMQENGRRQKDQEYQQFIAALPGKQRVLQDIKRKQSIMEGLYLYLLQKREETAISFSTSNASTYRQIDPPKAGQKPATPNRAVVKLSAVLLGLLIPFGYIKLREGFNNTIESKKEIQASTSIPVIGEIDHIKNLNDADFGVLISASAGEQFRMLRTNIALSSTDNNNKVILVTSGGNAEGKSFISKNLAAVLATPGKKVALLDFDLQPTTGAVTGKGIIDFLNGSENNLNNIHQKSGEIPGLYLFPSGTRSLHASDLLLTDNIKVLFSTLRKEFDYIVVEAAAIQSVSDAFLLNKFSDIVLFVVRLQTTLKKEIAQLSNAKEKDRLSNVGIIITDI